jgi:uncharacterized coiled-coil protein SlyX
VPAKLAEGLGELSSSSNLEAPTKLPLDSNIDITLNKPIDKNMPLIKQFFGIFYIKDLIYVKSYFQPSTLPSIIDINIISQSPISSNNVIITGEQNTHLIGYTSPHLSTYVEALNTRSIGVTANIPADSELLNRIATLEQELREANHYRDMLSTRNSDLNERLNYLTGNYEINSQELNSRISQQHFIIRNYQSFLHNCEIRINEINSELSIQLSNVNNLNLEISNKNTTISELNNKIFGLKENINLLESKLIENNNAKNNLEV